MRALVHRFFSFKEGEGRPAALLFALFFVVSLGNGVGLSAGESLFIQAWGVESLPLAFLAAAVGVLTIGMLLSRLSHRLAFPAFFRFVYGFTGILIAALACGLYFLPGNRIVSALLFVFAYMALVLLKNLLLQLSELVFDLRQLRRFFAVVSSGAVLGMAVGGFGLGLFLAVVPDTRALILVWGLALLAALAVSGPIFRRHARAENLTEKRREESGLLDGFRHLARSRLLVLLAIASFCTAFLVLQYDFLYMYAVKKTWTSPEEVTRVFGTVRGISTLATFAFQAFLTARLTRLIGLTPILLAFPAAFLAIYGGILVRFGMLNVLVGRLGYYLTKEAFFFPSLTPVFNALAEPVRRGAVFFIYSVMGSLGNIVAGLFLLLAVRTGELSLKGSMVVALGVSAVLVASVLMLRRQYVKELLQNLQEDSPRQLERVENLRALGGSDTPDMLMAQLASPDPESVRFALEFLSHQRTPERDQAVERVATTTAHSRVRRACFRYFGRSLSIPLLDRHRDFLSGQDRLPFIDWIGAALDQSTGTAEAPSDAPPEAAIAKARLALGEALRLPEENLGIAAALWMERAGAMTAAATDRLDRALDTPDPITRVFLVERAARRIPERLRLALRQKALEWISRLSPANPLDVRLIKALLKMDDEPLVVSLMIGLLLVEPWRPMLPKILESMEDPAICARIALALPADDYALITALPNPPPALHPTLCSLALSSAKTLPLRVLAAERLRHVEVLAAEVDRARWELSVLDVLSEASSDLEAASSFRDIDKRFMGIFADEIRRQVDERLSLASGLIGIAWARERLGGALAALDSENRALRSAALETLENTLPKAIREPFMQLVEREGRQGPGHWAPPVPAGAAQAGASLERLFLGATPWRSLLAMHLAEALDARELKDRVEALDDPHPQVQEMRRALLKRWSPAPS